MSIGLGRDDIRALLDDLSAELAARGARAELFLVGGAALAVAYDATRATRDLDAVFIPADVVRQAAAVVAEHRGLTEDWLNDAVKGFLPGPDPDAQRFYSSDSLIVDVASPRYLPAAAPENRTRAACAIVRATSHGGHCAAPADQRLAGSGPRLGSLGGGTSDLALARGIPVSAGSGRGACRGRVRSGPRSLTP